MFAKEFPIKFEDLYLRPDYNKKNKNNKNNETSFIKFIISINSFIYIILDKFI
jgi:hypothetical protein